MTVRNSFSSFHMYFRGERALSIAILRKFVIKHDLFSDRHPLVDLHKLTMGCILFDHVEISTQGVIQQFRLFGKTISIIYE